MADTLLDEAKALGPDIRAAAPTIEHDRALPPDLVRRLTDAGIFGMAAPRDRGGAQLDPVDQIDVVEELAYHDASVGWCVMIGCDNGYWSSWLAPDVVEDLWKHDPLGATGIVVAPGGMGVAVDGGYRLNGRWPFNSGRLHSRVTGAGFLVAGADGSLSVDDAGRPMWRVAFFPTESSETVDTWNTTGLAGTGSHDFTLADVFVPEERTCDLFGPSQRDEPLYRFSSFFLAKMGGVPLGVARRVLEELATLAASKVQMPSMTHLRDDPFVKSEFARADALVGSARSWLREVVGDLYATVEAGGTPTLQQRGRYRMAITHAFTSSKAAIEIAYELAGSSALYRPSIFDRALRDIVTACQHIVVQRKYTDAFGGALLGLEPDGAPFV